MKRVVALSLLLCAAASHVHAQMMERVVAVTGVVRIAGVNKPAERARVVLEQRGFHRGQDYTDSNGNFRFFPVGRGQYQITVHLEGYKPAVTTLSITSFSSKHVLIYLQKLPGESPGPGARVSVTELALPESARREYDAGMKALGKGSCRQSLPHFRKLTEMEPEFAGGFHGLGMGHYFCKDDTRAEQALRQAIALDGTLVATRILLARLLNNHSRHEEALAEIELAASTAPARADALFEWGRALTGLGRISEAETALRRGHEWKDASSEVHAQLANVLVLGGDLRGALEEMEHYLAEDPDGPFAAEAREKSALLRAELARADARP